MSTAMRASALVAFFYSAFLPCLEAKDFLNLGKPSEKYVDFELDELLAGHDAAAPESIDRLEKSLAPMYKALPKDADGRLEHTAVRYALHRLLVKERGWYVKGLEPDGSARNSSSPGEALKAWVPAHLFHVLEKRLHSGGLNLRELAAVAAAVEMSALQETKDRLQGVYDLFELDAKAELDAQKANDVLNIYMIVYMRGGNVTMSGLPQARRALKQFRTMYSRFNELNVWMQSIQNGIATTAAASAPAAIKFPTMLKIADELGAEYANFDSSECKKLKSTLTGLEGKKAARVPLSTFYEHGSNPESAFKFIEKVDYLRDLGALDESMKKSPSVIVPNYVSSRPNCMEASGFYAICCKNECEDIMGMIEEGVGGPSASTQQIVQLVQDISTETVMPNRTLPKKLTQRLDQVAQINGGSVPLHGRLFAQWLHHAFPHECPFPHEAGKTNPMTADEWIKQKGHASTAASAEELEAHIKTKGDAEAVSDDGNEAGVVTLLEEAEEAMELPWSEAEELLVVDQFVHRGVGLRMLANIGIFFAMGAAMMSTVYSALAARNGETETSKKAKHLKQSAGAEGQLQII